MIRWVRRRIKLILCSVFLVLALSYACFTESGLYKVYKLQLERDQYEREIKALQEGNAALSERAKLLGNDQETIERTIRDKLRMVLPEDTIFVFESSQITQSAGNQN